MNDEQPTQPLTDERLVEIRNHVDHQLMVDRSVNTIATRNLAEAVDDRSALLAEVDRLRAALTALGRNEQAAGNRSLELQEERSEMLSDFQWYISDLGPEHWQHCDVGDEDCYLCAGHVAIRDRWKGVE